MLTDYYLPNRVYKIAPIFLNKGPKDITIKDKDDTKTKRTIRTKRTLRLHKDPCQDTLDKFLLGSRNTATDARKDNLDIPSLNNSS